MKENKNSVGFCYLTEETLHKDKPKVEYKMEDKLVFHNLIKSFLEQPYLVNQILLDDTKCDYLGDRLFSNFEMCEISNHLDIVPILNIQKFSCKEVIETHFVKFIRLDKSVSSSKFVDLYQYIKKEFEQDFLVMSDKLTKEILSLDYVQEYICVVLAEFDFDYQPHIDLEKIKRFMLSLDDIE